MGLQIYGATPASVASEASTRSAADTAEAAARAAADSAEAARAAAAEALLQPAATASTDAERDAHMASGTLAARPAAATYGVGRYYATDHGIEYASDGTTWYRLTPLELWSDSTETTIANIAATRTDIAALEPATFDVVAGFAVIVEFFSPYNTHLTTGGTINGYISDNAGADAAANVKEQAITSRCSSGATPVGPFRVLERITTPGTYTRKPQVAAGGGASGAANGVVASSAIHPRFRVYEAPLG